MWKHFCIFDDNYKIHFLDEKNALGFIIYFYDQTHGIAYRFPIVRAYVRDIRTLQKNPALFLK